MGTGPARPAARRHARAVADGDGLAPVESTYVVCTNDQIVHPGLQAILARRCSHQVEWATSHSPFLSQPALVAGLLGDIARSAAPG